MEKLGMSDPDDGLSEGYGDSTMSLELSECLLSAGVSQHILNKLTEDEVSITYSHTDIAMKLC
jgi:hypothetical protein